METNITHFCLIYDFLDVDFNSNDISRIIKQKVDHILKFNNFNIPSDWILTFNATYNNSKFLLISKNKFGGYKSEKRKEISIVIPIPLIDKINWGVNEKNFIYDINHYDNILHNFWALEIDPNYFNNRTDYILFCMLKGIKKSFYEGFTVGGIKLKTNMFPNFEEEEDLIWV